MPRYKSRHAALLCALLVLPVITVVRAQPDLQTQPVAAEAIETKIEGEVMVVNADTRLMTLKLADGTYKVLHVPPEVTRLDEIKIGDMVSITETTTALIELQTGRDAGAMGAEGDTTVERAPGEKPAGTITDELTLYGKIVGVDKAAGTVTIKGAETTRVFPVEDAALLDELKVGDGVVAKFRNVISGEVMVK
ncbi:copper-binding protein [uncultured Thiohalocapsa sp.]|uniref:copper-binding protein n=1 Tax=uncultured Thiohalocapsa sp. TaxID=768990 RepID=UPI0025E878F8|nr:copper-binding protein [uncultured Thiohalocapsa sp.]